MIRTLILVVLLYAGGVYVDRMIRRPLFIGGLFPYVGHRTIDVEYTGLRMTGWFAEWLWYGYSYGTRLEFITEEKK